MPQPHQLTKERARRIAIARYRRHRKTAGPAARIGSYFLDGTVAYGHRPWQAGLCLIAQRHFSCVDRVDRLPGRWWKPAATDVVRPVRFDAGDAR